MKAILYNHYGSPDVLEYGEVPTPSPGPDEVLLRVRAASVNPLDWRFMRGTPYIGRVMFGAVKPKMTRPGTDIAGIVEAVGSGVADFKTADAVFGTCRGAFAEYACTTASRLVTKPARITFEEAAAAPIAAITALQALRDKGHVHEGQRVLINGAAGGVGTFAVQIARHFGAEVTGVCSTRNVDMVRSIGAERAIDYTREDFTAQGERYDLLLDAVGNRPLSACRRVLRSKGVYVAVAGPDGRWIGPLAHLIKVLLLSPFVSQTLSVCMAKANKTDLTTIRDLMESGQIRSVIDRQYRLSEAAEAVRYVEEGHARGKVVITLEHQ